MRLIAVTLFVICSLLPPAYAQVEDDYLKSHLDQLQTQLELYAINAPAEQKLKVLQQNQYWFSALNAYGNLPTLSIYDKLEKLDADELKWLTELEGHIKQYTTTEAGKTNAQGLAKQYTESLATAKNQFVVQPIKPIYYFVGNDSIIDLTLHGSFPLLLKDTSEIYLQAGTNKVTYTSATDSSITFRFALSQLGLGNAVPFGITSIKVNLVGQVGKKINKKKQFIATYNLQAIALPTSPGKLTITKSSNSTNTEKQTKRTRTFLLNGSKGNLVEKQCVPAHDGWTLVPESVELVVESSSGTLKRDWNYRKTNSGGKICYTAEVFFNSAGPSGKLEYHLKYDITRNTSAGTSETSEVPLSWGQMDQLNFDIPVTKLIYTDMWGTESIIEGNSFQSPWVQLEMQSQNSIAIKTTQLVP